MKRGEIWVVNFDPVIGNEIQKMRPAVIIQNDIGNAHSDITIVAPITSRHIDHIYPTDASIGVSSGLEFPSKALLNQIRAVDKKRLHKKIGVMHDMSAVDEAIKISLGLVPI